MVSTDGAARSCRWVCTAQANEDGARVLCRRSWAGIGTMHAQRRTHLRFGQWRSHRLHSSSNSEQQHTNTAGPTFAQTTSGSLGLPQWTSLLCGTRRVPDFIIPGLGGARAGGQRRGTSDASLLIVWSEIVTLYFTEPMSTSLLIISQPDPPEIGTSTCTSTSTGIRIIAYL